MRLLHGTTDLVQGAILLPPTETAVLSEKGRKKNLNRVFLTQDAGLARIYAGRAAKSIGGKPVVYECFAFDRDVIALSDAAGATVFHASAAYIVGRRS